LAHLTFSSEEGVVQEEDADAVAMDKVAEEMAEQTGNALA